MFYFPVSLLAKVVLNSLPTWAWELTATMGYNLKFVFPFVAFSCSDVSAMISASQQMRQSSAPVQGGRAGISSGAAAHGRTYSAGGGSFSRQAANPVITRDEPRQTPMGVTSQRIVSVRTSIPRGVQCDCFGLAEVLHQCCRFEFISVQNSCERLAFSAATCCAHRAQ